jgi:hypothetical protein
MFLKKSFTLYMSQHHLFLVQRQCTKLIDIRSKLYISFQGTEGKSKELVLSPNGFKKGSFNRIKIFSEDVGNLQNIKVRIQ